MIFVPFSGIEWYIKLPLRIPVSPAEITLNEPLVLNDTEWYSMVISGIPLARFCKGPRSLHRRTNCSERNDTGRDTQ